MNESGSTRESSRTEGSRERECKTRTHTQTMRVLKYVLEKYEEILLNIYVPNI